MKSAKHGTTGTNGEGGALPDPLLFEAIIIH